MQLVSQEVSTGRATMAIVDGEEGAARPVFHLLELGPDDVEDDGDAVFVIVTNDALVGVRCIRGDNTVLLTGKLGRVIGRNEAIDLLLFHLHVLLLLLHRHDEAAIGCQLVLALRCCQRLLVNNLVGARWLRLACLVSLIELLRARPEVATVLAAIRNTLRLVSYP